MATPQPLEPLLEPITAAQRLIDQFDQQGIIIGGVAVSLLGQPRLTWVQQFADLLEMPELWDDMEKLLESN